MIAACAAMETTAAAGLRAGWATGLPMVSMLLRSPAGFSLDASELGLLLFLVALDGELDKAVDELFVGEAGGFPEFWVHADGGEAGQRVDLVEVDARLLPLF